MSKPFRYRGGWRMQVTLSNGKRPTRNFDNYEEAKAWGAKVLAGEESEHTPLFGGPRQTTLAKALDHYAGHFSIAKRGLNAELNRINHYLEGAGMPLLKAMKTPGGGYEVHEAEPARRKPGKRTLSDYVQRRRELRAKTYDYIAQLARKTCSQVSKADIQGLYAQMKSDGLSESTIQKEIALLKTVYNAFEQYNWKDVENPCTGIKLGAHRRRFVHLSEEQIAALERALANVENPYFWPLVVVAKESTLRLGSIVGMRWEQLNLSDRTAMLDTKTGQRLYKFSRQVAEVLEGLPRDPSGHVFPMTKTAIDSAWERVRIAAGLPKLQFRDLRHLGATDWVRRGLRLAELKDLLSAVSVIGDLSQGLYVVLTHQLEDMQHRFVMPVYEPAVAQFVKSHETDDYVVALGAEGGIEALVVPGLPNDGWPRAREFLPEVARHPLKEMIEAFGPTVSNIARLDTLPALGGRAVRQLSLSVVLPTTATKLAFADTTVAH